MVVVGRGGGCAGCSPLDSSAASDVYKGQAHDDGHGPLTGGHFAVASLYAVLAFSRAADPPASALNVNAPAFSM